MKFSITNLLSLVTIVALAIALALTAMTTDRMLKIDSAATNYSWNLRQSLVAKSPVWENRDLAPPMHLGEAIAISDEIVKELNIATKPLNIGGWELDGITLSPLDGGYQQERQRWCYLARFYGTRQPIHSGEPEIFDAIILMDGTIFVGEGNWRPEIDDAMRKIYR